MPTTAQLALHAEIAGELASFLEVEEAFISQLNSTVTVM
jgi:hypothetical protein